MQRTHRWRVCRLTAVDGQPNDGFAGPGLALRWLQSTDIPAEQVGVDVLIVRDDGARPKVNTKGERSHVNDR